MTPRPARWLSSSRRASPSASRAGHASRRARRRRGNRRSPAWDRRPAPACRLRPNRRLQDLPLPRIRVLEFVDQSRPASVRGCADRARAASGSRSAVASASTAWSWPITSQRREAHRQFAIRERRARRAADGRGSGLRWRPGMPSRSACACAQRRQHHAQERLPLHSTPSGLIHSAPGPQQSRRVERDRIAFRIVATRLCPARALLHAPQALLLRPCGCATAMADRRIAARRSCRSMQRCASRTGARSQSPSCIRLAVRSPASRPRQRASHTCSASASGLPQVSARTPAASASPEQRTPEVLARSPAASSRASSSSSRFAATRARSRNRIRRARGCRTPCSVPITAVSIASSASRARVASCSRRRRPATVRARSPRAPLGISPSSSSRGAAGSGAAQHFVARYAARAQPHGQFRRGSARESRHHDLFRHQPCSRIRRSYSVAMVKVLPVPALASTTRTPDSGSSNGVGRRAHARPSRLDRDAVRGNVMLAVAVQRLGRSPSGADRYPCRARRCAPRSSSNSEGPPKSFPSSSGRAAFSHSALSMEFRSVAAPVLAQRCHARHECFTNNGNGARRPFAMECDE